MAATQTPAIKQGWIRVLIYVIGICVIAFILQLAGSIVSHQLNVSTEKGTDAVLNFGISYALMGLFFVLLTWVMRRFVDRKSFTSLGFTWKGYSNEAGLGFFCALAILGIGSLILVASQNISFISFGFDASSFLMEIVIMIVVAFVEELVFRGYILSNLLQSTNKWFALGVSSVLFALVHGTNPDVTVFAIVNILVAGFLLGLNYIFTKNLWFGIFFHFAWNYFQGPVLGYQVSGLKLTSLLQQTITGSDTWTGGPFGFEGSLLCPMLSIIALIVFAFLFINRYEAAAQQKAIEA